MSETNESKQSAASQSEDVTFVKQGNGYVIKDANGGHIGEITYRPADEHTWILDHTFVDPRFRGGNLAKRLLNAVVDEARAQGRKIIPACSYALAQFRRSSEYADVWQKE